MVQNFGEVCEEPRGNGRVRHFVMVTVPEPDGSRKRHKIFSAYSESLGKRVPFKTKADADGILAAIRALISTGETPDRAVARFLPKQEEDFVIPRWRQFVEARRATRERDPIGDKRLKELGRYVVRGYLDFFDRVSVRDLKPQLLQTWLDEYLYRHWPTWEGEPKRVGRGNPKPTPEQRARGIRGFHSPKMRHHVVNDFLTFDGWLRGRGLREDQPLKKPKLPAVSKERQPVPSEATLERYIAAIPEDRRGLFMLRSYDGVRIEEGRRLNVGNYRWLRYEDGSPKGEIRIDDTKTDAGIRGFEVDRELAAWLDKWVPPSERFNPRRPLFINPNSFSAASRARWPNKVPTGRWTATAEKGVHDAACKAIGCYFPPNAMARHAAATHMLLRTKERFGFYDIEQVRQKLGHTDRATTDGYIDNRMIDVSGVARLPRPPAPGGSERTGSK